MSLWPEAFFPRGPCVRFLQCRYTTDASGCAQAGRQHHTGRANNQRYRLTKALDRGRNSESSRSSRGQSGRVLGAERLFLLCTPQPTHHAPRVRCSASRSLVHHARWLLWAVAWLTLCWAGCAQCGKVAASVSSDVVRERVCSACVACVLDLAARLSLPLQCDPGPATNPRNRGSHLTNPAGKPRQLLSQPARGRARALIQHDGSAQDAI